jgi:hypothetical protein
MATLELTVDQVIELVKQLPSQDQNAILRVINLQQEQWWEKRTVEGEQRMINLCTERGLDWDKMTEDEREVLIDQLMHED